MLEAEMNGRTVVVLRHEELRNLEGIQSRAVAPLYREEPAGSGTAQDTLRGVVGSGCDGDF